MKQLFYNIAGGIEHQIRHEKRTTISEVIVRVKRNIMQNRNCFFISNFLLKVRVLHLNNFKTEKSKLTFEDQFVICLVLPECLSVKICCISSSNSEANRDGADADSPFPLFFSFSASFKNSSPREKVGNCLRFGTGGWSLCFYPGIMVAKYLNIFPHANTMAARAKKKFLAKRFAHAIGEHYRDLEHAYVLKYTEFDCAALQAML